MNTNVEDMFSYQATGSKNSRHALLPDPFCDFASTAMPRSKSDVLRLCEHVWLMSGQFKTAMQRIVRYFLTSVEIVGDISDAERKKYKEFLDDTLKIMEQSANAGDDLLCYGNSFTSLYMPFNRILICKECNFTISIDKVNKFKLDTKSKTFKAHCIKCGKQTDHDHKDLRSMDETRIHLVRWNPHEIELTNNFISGETNYTWRINEQFKKMIRKGDEFWVRHTPWEIIEAAIDGDTFKFNKDAIYHMKEPTIAGVENRGWGIPRLLGAFKDVYYVQMLKRYNEALALDYIVPFRVITPAKAGVADPMMHHDMNQWTSNLNQLLEDHRRNPTGYHTVPFPVSYQALSGEGVQLSPFQLIKQGNADLMDAIGVPVELFQGTMSLQAAPTALRLFQATWPQLVSSLDSWLTWVVTKVGNFFGWEEVDAKLQPVTYADDLERKGMLLQLQAANQVSKQTAFSFLGVDPKEEARKIMDEQKDQTEMQREFEEDQMKVEELQQMSEQGAQTAAAGGGMDGGMAPAPQPVPGMGTPMAAQPGQGAITPEELMNQAQEMAQQLIGMDETTRKSQLIQLKRSNPMLHAQVSQIMTNMRQDAATQGVAALHSQMASQPAM
jgi:hypothetical protein